MQDGRQIIVTQTTATLDVYAERAGIRLETGSIEEWKRPAPRPRE